MRRLAYLAPFAVMTALAATPAAADPTVTVTLGPKLQEQIEDLGAREVDEQVARLTQVVERTLAQRGALDGARIDLVLTDLRPNKPTFEQLADRPGLDYIRSLSLGGAAFEGQVTTADGRVEPIRYDWFSSNLNDVRYYTTWQDADRAYERLARNLADGRFVKR